MYPYNSNENKSNQTMKVSLNTRENTNALYRLSKDKHFLELLETAAQDTENTMGVYETLSKDAKLGKDSSIIRNAYLDELKHSKQFQDIYYQITGERMQLPAKKQMQTKSPLPKELNLALEALIAEELENTDFYRDLLLLMPQGMLWDMMFEMLTDKQDHCTRLCFLYCKYK